MTEKHYTVIDKEEPRGQSVAYKGIHCTARHCCTNLNRLTEENEHLKKELNKLEKFEHGGEHIRLSINIETGELQRHIYATGQWFGDFDRVLVDNWLSKEDYQRFINRIIEVYNTEFKKEFRE